MRMTMMMVMMCRNVLGRNMTILFMAMLIAGFDFNGYMTNSMFFEFFTDGVLYFVMIAVGNNMHRCKVVLTIDAPKVDVMYIQNTVNLLKMFFDFCYFYIMRCFFQK